MSRGANARHDLRVNDYERVAQAIRFLDERHVEQPDLASLCARLGLSPSHFHRLFSKWAGVTPKDFLQCLTLSHAKELLRRGETVFDAALETGLSGPSRLHDLCVQLEAATPGEVRSGGEGLEIRYGSAETPFGRWMVAETARGICRISFSEKDGAADLRNDWPKATFTRDDSAARDLARRGLARNAAALKMFVRGTPFQLQVWRALLQIPAGALVSYGNIASAIGAPSACRAVGTAVGANPIAFLIPCHRVIRETGVIGNYRWGPERKRAILAWESAAAL